VNVKRALERIPADREAEDRAWAVVRSAFEAREAVPRGRLRVRWTFAVVGVAAVCAAAALSPPGRAVVNAVRRSIGIEHAAPALFRLPSSGRLLVSGRGGTWVVAADGSKRRLGSWPGASWSPHGLFVVAWSHDGLAAVEPADGTVRWSLGRPDVSRPSWGGTRTDTRIAYFSGSSLRVVAGDGTGDRLLARAAKPVVPVWRPERHVVAFVSASGAVVVQNVDSGVVVARHRVTGAVRSLAWSVDGARLAVATSRGVAVFGRKAVTLPLREVRSVTFADDGELALLTPEALLIYGPEGLQTVLRVQTRLAGVAWSPDGRWLVTSLPRADQWVFVGRRHVLAVSHIARQFGGAAPSLDGWLPGA
jgi:WD40 repeat protein